jgi:hypothetical protein
MASHLRAGGASLPWMNAKQGLITILETGRGDRSPANSRDGWAMARLPPTECFSAGILRLRPLAAAAEAHPREARRSAEGNKRIPPLVAYNAMVLTIHKMNRRMG